MTSSKTLFYFCISFVVGITISSIIAIPQIFIWGFFILGFFVIITSLFFKKNYGIVLGFSILILTLGIMRFQIWEFAMAGDQLRKFNDNPNKITLIGVIRDDPDVRDNLQKLIITTETIIIQNQQFPIKSDVLVTLSNFGATSEYRYLDRVSLTGKLKTPAIFPARPDGRDFNYKNYLAKDGIYSVMDYPDIEIISQAHQYTLFTYAYEKILWLKSVLMHSINNSLSPPHSFILEGMVFGNDKHMPKELKEQFTATGLSHVTAVSGTNIVITISILMVFLLSVGFWRGQAFYGAVIFIWIYIALIGFPVSGIRAAIMGCILLLAQKLGRQNTGSRTIVLAAGLMLMQNPSLLRYDVGFQLSFLASLGIIYIKPLIDIFFTFITKDHFKTLTDMISITISAQIITLPVIVYDFGRISLIAPIANMFALPLVGPLTILGFLLSLFGAMLPALAFIFSIPCWFLLTYFMEVLDLFSQPWATKNVEQISLVWVIVYYSVLILAIWYLHRFKKPKFLGY